MQKKVVEIVRLTEWYDQVRYVEDRVGEYQDERDQNDWDSYVLAKGKALTIYETVWGGRVNVFRAEDASADYTDSSPNAVYGKNIKRVVYSSSLVKVQTSHVTDDACYSSNAHCASNGYISASWGDRHQSNHNSVTRTDNWRKFAK